MTIFQIFQRKEAIFCSKAVLLVERLQTQRPQNSKKYNPQKISREQNYTLHVCKRCAVSWQESWETISHFSYKSQDSKAIRQLSVES